MAHGRKAARIRATAVAAVLVLGVGAVAGCEAGTGDGAAVRISKLPEEPVPPPESAPSPDASDPPRPSRTAEHGEPAPAAPSPVGSKRPDAAEQSQRVVLAAGAEGKRVRELQARLHQLKLFSPDDPLNPTGYYGSVTAAAVSAFQKQQGEPRTGKVTEGLWDTLTARTDEPTRPELYPSTARPLDDPDPRCLTGRALCVSKESRTLAWMVDGEVRSAMDVRFGSAYTPTREGEFKVDFKSRDHHSTLYDTPMPYALFFSGGQAVHYSADFAATGYSGASHGCVNVRDKKRIAALFAEVKPGDKVVVHR